jgi:hypothetical protein
MFRKMSKRTSWGEVARNYWEKLVCGIPIPGERGSWPSEGEILSAYNEMKVRHPECRCNILKAGAPSKQKTSSGDLFQRGDRITGIWIIRLLESTDVVLEFFMSSSDLYVCLKRNGLHSILVRSTTCDLQQTMRNFEAFITNFPTHLADLEQEKIEFEKRLKIEKMAKLSIRTGVSQILSPLGYDWDLVDKGEYFTLRIGLGKKKLVEMTLNDKNFTKRIPIIPHVLENVENFLENLTFPIDISMTKGLVKL